MSNWIPGRYVPSAVPGEDLACEDMARVTVDDYADLRRMARGYCRTVDATRSRKRMDGSATVVRNGHAPHGTDDVSGDVAHDAVLLFARRLRDALARWPVAAMWLDTREASAWQYERRDGQIRVITRATLQRWAVRDAASRNGYRVDVPASEQDATPGAQTMAGLKHVEHMTAVALEAAASVASEAVWRTAFSDGADYPTLRELVFLGSEADDLGRDGLFATVAQGRHGGAYGSRRAVRRTRDTARAEWSELRERLDGARDDLFHAATRTHATGQSADE